MKIHADGICEPNPGKGAWAFVVLENGQTVHKEWGYLGDGCTNNVAEYMAVIRAAEYVQKRGVVGAEIFTDSQLVVKQVNRAWACNNEKLRELRDITISIVDSIAASVQWVPGRENEADEWTRHAYQNSTGIYPQPRVKAA